jgi:hypothetical protein
MPASSKIWPLIVIHLGVLLFNTLIGTPLSVRPSLAWYPFGLWYAAVPLAQIGLLGAWAALGAEPLRWRLPLSFSLLALPGAALALPCDRDVNWVRWYGLLVLLHWLAVQLALCPLRIRWGPWGTPFPRSPAVTATGRLQFGVRDLLLWTLLVAVALGVYRWLFRGAGSFEWWLFVDKLHVMLASAAVAALFMLTAVWAIWSRREPRWRLAATAVVWLSVTVVQCLLSDMGRPWPSLMGPCYLIFVPEWEWRLAFATVGQTSLLLMLIVAASLAVLRTEGFRLTEVKPAVRDVQGMRVTALVLLGTLFLLISFCRFARSPWGGDRWPGIFRCVQAGLLALWFVLGRPAIAWRLPLVVLLLLLVDASRLCHFAPWLTGSSIVLYAGLSLVLWLFVQVPLWGLRITAGLRLGADEDTGPSHSDDRERAGAFSLLIWATAIVAFEALGCWGYSRYFYPLWLFESVTATVVPWLFVCLTTSILAMVATGVTLASRPRLGWVALAVTVGFVAIVVPGYSLPWVVGGPELELSDWKDYAAVTTLLLATLLYLRCLGYRLAWND